MLSLYLHALPSFSPSFTLLTHSAQPTPIALARCYTTGFEWQGHSITQPRCRILALDGGDKKQSGLTDTQIEELFREFDTSGDGFVDLLELQAALSKSGKPLSMEQAQEILSAVRPVHGHIDTHSWARTHICHIILSALPVRATGSFAGGCECRRPDFA